MGMASPLTKPCPMPLHLNQQSKNKMNPTRTYYGFLLGVLLLLALGCKIMGSDAANETIEKQEWLREERKIFEMITKKEATNSTVREYVEKIGVNGSEAVAVAHAVYIFAQSEDIGENEKIKAIASCAKNNSGNSAIVHKCAEVLEPSEASIKLYAQVAGNSNFSTTMRLAALRRLVLFQTLPKLTPEIIIAGLSSENKNDVELSKMLLEKMRNSDITTASEYLKAIEALRKSRSPME